MDLHIIMSDGEIHDADGVDLSLKLRVLQEFIPEEGNST
jgi:hypothetical protein